MVGNDINDNTPKQEKSGTDDDTTAHTLTSPNYLHGIAEAVGSGSLTAEVTQSYGLTPDIKVQTEHMFYFQDIISQNGANVKSM